MDNKDNNEMEQIQQGLEAFLEKELDIIGSSKNEGQRNGAGRTRRTGYSREERTEAFRRNRPDRPEEEYDRIRIIGEDLDSGYDEDTVYFEDTDEAYGQEGLEGEDWDYRKPRQGEEGRIHRSQVRQEEDQIHRSRVRQEEDQIHRSPKRQGQSQVRRSPQVQEETRSQRAPQSQTTVRNQRRAKSGKEARFQKAAYSEADCPEAEQSGKRKRSRAQEQVPQKEFQMAGKPPKSKKAQKKKKKKFRLMKVLIVAAVVAVLLGVGLYQLVGVVYGKMNYSAIASVTGEPMQEDGVVNILLIGNDSRENGADGRSDAMILLSISSKTKTIYMTSLLRDMYVEIPGHDDNRLNAAYSFGGAELLMETVEKNFDIPVNRYMLVNFEGFANLVDTVGGIELELTSEEIEYVNGYLVEYNMLTGRPQGTDNMDTSVSGLVHLNGPQALAYSRNRYLGTDFGRTDRQRKVLTAVIKKLPSVMLTSAGELMDGLLPNLTTNLTQDECFRLSLMAGRLLTYEIVSDSIPQPGTYSNATIRKMAVLEVDFDTNIRYLKEKIYGE